MLVVFHAGYDDGAAVRSASDGEEEHADGGDNNVENEEGICTAPSAIWSSGLASTHAAFKLFHHMHSIINRGIMSLHYLYQIHEQLSRLTRPVTLKDPTRLHNEIKTDPGLPPPSTQTCARCSRLKPPRSPERPPTPTPSNSTCC